MSDKFPFGLDDIAGWVVRMKDGTIVRYNVVDPQVLQAKTAPASPTWHGNYSGFYGGYSALCKHEPHPASTPALFEQEGIRIWIADASGARKVAGEFDVCIDGGSVLSVPGEHDLPDLYGDPSLATSLSEHVIKGEKSKIPDWPKILKIRWWDREAPPLYTTFWPALLARLKQLQKKKSDGILNVLTICQGGHGRSGTAAACLIMCMTDYTPLDVLTHIRALHCARAIESKVQHEYLNLMANRLGRTENALEAGEVSSFKDRFLELDSAFAQSYKERLRSGGGAAIEKRDSSFI